MMNEFIQLVYADGGLVKMILAEFIRGMAWTMGALLVFGVAIMIYYKKWG